MRSCGLLTLNYIKMTSIDLLKEIESWLSFNTEPSKEETAKLRKSIKEHLAEQLRIDAIMRMMAISFAKWLRDNTVTDDAPKLLLRLDMKRYTIEELYDLYTLIAK